MHKAVLIICTLWAALSGTRAQCDQTLDLTGNMDIAIDGSITTCIRCVDDGTVLSNTQWSAEDDLLISGMNGVQINSNDVLMITDGSVFLSNLPNPFELSCASPGGDITSDVYLAGFFAPTVFVSSSGGSTVIDEGDTIVLRCDDSNIPGSTMRTWLDPQGVPDPDSFRNLILSNIQRNQTGEYRCQLTNVMDNATLSDSITVTVTYPTSVTSDSPASQFLGLGSLLSLTCTYDSVPPSTLTWYLDGVQLSAGVTTSGATSTLTVSSVLRTSGGEYMCTATNTLASGTNTTASLSFNVTIEVPPDPATNLAVSNIQETSVDLSWNNGFDGFSDITGVEIQVITGGSIRDNLTINGDDSLEFTTVPNLVPFTNYEFRLFVRNIRGLSTPVSVSNMTLSLTLLAPTILSLISPSSTSLRVTWAPPAPNTTTDDPNSWIIRLLDSGEAMDNTVQDPATTEFLFIGLEKGTEYGVRVAGTNDRGMGAFSATVTNKTLIDPPTVPQNLVGTAVSAFGFELSWTGPAEDGGGVVSEYVVGYREMGGSEFNDITLDSDMTELLLRNGGDPAPPVALVNSTTYEIRVQAVNEAGRGAEATTTLTTQSIDQPQRIFDPLVPSDVTNLTAMISWVFPGGMVTNFIVQYKFRADAWTAAGKVNVITVPGNTTSVLLPDLTPEAQYDIRVRTMNTLGVSEFSFEATFVTAPPSPPIVEGPTSAPAGQRVRINCSSSVTDLSFTWYRVTSESNASALPTTAEVVGTDLADLVFTEPTVMDTGIYVCRLGNSVTTRHTITFIGSQGASGISLEVIIIVCVVGGVALLVFLCVIVLACYCLCCAGSSSTLSKKSKSNYNVKTKSQGKGKGKRSMTWIETSTKFVPNTNPNYTRTSDDPSPFDMPEDLTTHSSFNTLEKQNRIRQNENPYTNNSNV